MQQAFHRGTHTTKKTREQILCARQEATTKHYDTVFRGRGQET